MKLIIIDPSISIDTEAYLLTITEYPNYLNLFVEMFQI